MKLTVIEQRNARFLELQRFVNRVKPKKKSWDRFTFEKVPELSQSDYGILAMGNDQESGCTVWEEGGKVEVKIW